jgi:hypothetical protein
MGFTHLPIEWNLWLGGYHPQISILSALCPQLNLLNPPQKKKIPGYTTDVTLYYVYIAIFCGVCGYAFFLVIIT